MIDRICQSCGLPMSEKDGSVGRNFDGTYSSEYCSYCFDLGEFTVPVTLEEMIDLLVPMVMGEETGMNEEEAREYLNDYLIKLRRWQKKEGQSVE